MGLPEGFVLGRVGADLAGRHIGCSMPVGADADEYRIFM